MSIKVQSILGGRVIYWDCGKNVRVADLQRAEVETLILMDKTSISRIHVVFDFTDMVIGASVSEIMNVQWLLPKHKKNASNVFIGLKKPLHQMAISIFGNIGRVDTRFVKSHPQALEYLRRKDSSIP